MEKGNEPKSKSTDRELTITRLLNAPIQLVWEVFTKPGHIKNWWGPNGFTNTIHKMEVKPGGIWQFIMHGPDGTDFENENVFTEVVKPARIVFEHVNNPRHITTITFEADGEKTLLKWHMLFESKEQFEMVVKTYRADTGLEQNIEKLAKYLAVSNLHASSEPFVIERIYNAPVAKVWSAITNKDEMKQWYFDLSAFEPKVGFEFSFTGSKDGESFLHLCQVKEVEPYKRLAYSWRYQGHEGNSIVTFELFAEGDKTRLKLTHVGLETFTVFKRDNFVDGWTHIIGTSLQKYLG